MNYMNEEKIRSFIGVIPQLYNSFFTRFPFLKPIVINAVLHGSGNYGLIIREAGSVVGRYTVIQCTEGSVISEGMDDCVNVIFSLQAALVDDIIENKDRYIAKPYRLLKYFFTYIKSITIRDSSFYSQMLYGSKVVLRPGDESDLPYLMKWYNDNELNKLAGWSNTKVTAQRLMYNITRSFGYDPMNLMIDNEDGKPIGTIQLYDFSDQDRSCRLGIRIGDSDYWGKGFGEDAVNTIVAYAFNKLDMFRVSLKVYEYNERAVNCYKKCGFVMEGKTRKSAFIDGKFYDEYIMGVLKSEFIERSPSNK